VPLQSRARRRAYGLKKMATTAKYRFVAAVCLALLSQFSHAVENPEEFVNLLAGSFTDGQKFSTGNTLPLVNNRIVFLKTHLICIQRVCVNIILIHTKTKLKIIRLADLGVLIIGHHRLIYAPTLKTLLIDGHDLPFVC
jgi:hypothetical protein